LYALPFTIQLNALYYNKDIFDRRGVAYPKDGMTWEDAMELAKKLSHKEGTVQYRGLGPETIVRLSAPYNLTYIDSKTGKASINSDGWRRVFEMAKSIYAIPNNTTPNLLAYNEKPAFLKDQNLAMLGTINLLPQLEDAGNKGLNWDVAQYPSYKDRPNISGIVDVHVMGITKTSKYKEQGMKVIEVITSEEVQTLSARATARISSLNNKEIQKQLGADMAFLRGKHLEAFFQSAAVPAAVRSQFEDINTEPYKAVMQSFKDFFEGKDINTALREAEEKINLFMDGRKK
jgi:multiple sugar transport system substrate-binding protein